ncbi:MAG: hypothetical protein IT367_12895 [Candidatus Hydrogenedentes bacterium]|nr:hypothetical protein [Candidatus Hydrogenedentota bacterium]
MSKSLDAEEACQLPDDISYEEWVNYVFDHPLLKPEWWFQDAESGYLQEWREDKLPKIALDYMTRLFSEPAFLIDRFSRAQIDQGLNFLVSNSCSSHMFVLTNGSLPWSARRACFDAMIPLYAKLMAPVYGNDIAYLDRAPQDPDRPNYACYMWWDVIPLYAKMGGPDSERIDDAVFHIFEEVLKLKSEACLESVLHGIGHWHFDYPERTCEMVESFLRRTDISPELRRYAEFAARGCVN